MTSQDFRDIALSLPEVSENVHMDHPDFRVRGKIFATLGYPDLGSGMVKLRPEEQVTFVGAEPAAFAPANGAWGRRGATVVRLETVTETTLRHAIVCAWRNIAPKRLGNKLEQ
jgi:hypothetical protein